MNLGDIDKDIIDIDDLAKDVLAGKDVLIIARHGKPALSRRVLVDWRGYRQWWEAYDAGGLAKPQHAPPKITAYARRADIVMSSPLRRAVETAKMAAGRDLDIIDPDLIEAALPSPHLGKLRLSPHIWGIISRFVWLLGWADGMETNREARARAKRMSQKLTEMAADGKLVFVAAHGWYNLMLKRALKKQGWDCTQESGNEYWSHRRYERNSQPIKV